MRMKKIKFIAEINNLYNGIGNDMRTIENMLGDDKSTKEDILKVMIPMHASRYEQGTEIGLVFDDGGAVILSSCKSCD